MSLNTSNILLNPLPELQQAFSNNSFGIDSYRLRAEECYPSTPAEIELVRKEVEKNGGGVGGISERVVGRGWMKLLDEEGQGWVRLDRSGWTIESATGQPPLLSKIGKTYESLETLLIDTSRAYAEAMNKEIWKRFEGHPGLQEDPHEQDEGEAAKENGQVDEGDDTGKNEG
nr:uncharacterized protein CI109_000243 [Kwoniella shandongensis]KAA5531402.1 hypothetical protein CI109_000243 [Kwoniella shandongensis]